MYLLWKHAHLFKKLYYQHLKVNLSFAFLAHFQEQFKVTTMTVKGQISTQLNIYQSP